MAMCCQLSSKKEKRVYSYKLWRVGKKVKYLQPIVFSTLTKLGEDLGYGAFATIVYIQWLSALHIMNPDLGALG
jgi:hypothetical protein